MAPEAVPSSRESTAAAIRERLALLLGVVDTRRRERLHPAIGRTARESVALFGAALVRLEGESVRSSHYLHQQLAFSSRLELLVSGCTHTRIPIG